MLLVEKIELLKEDISKYGKVIIAYSGGVDSSLLLNAACNMLGPKNVIAVTATSPTYTDRELKTAKKIAKQLKVKHLVIKTCEFDNENFTKNTELRCYYCKDELFNKLNKIRSKYDCNVIMDGTNYDDKDDYRPGSKAEIEHNIATPLKTAYFTKDDIREYSKQLGLITHDYPTQACLSSRVPYYEKINKKKIKQIKKGEKFLSQYGFKNLRLRTSKTTARIEVDAEDLKKVLENRERIIKKLRSIGYDYITLDLEGFKSGSMNRVLRNN